MEYYTITDAEHKPLFIEGCYLVKVREIDDIERFIDEYSAHGYLLDIVAGLQDWLILSEEVKLPLMVAIVNIDIEIVHLNQPNNRIKFI